MVEPPTVSTADSMSYAAAADLAAVRAFVRARGAALGLAPNRVDLLTLAVSELTTNTLQHTTGGGSVRVWAEAGQLVCEVVDQGPPRNFGRLMPPAEAVRGRGLAIVERICDDLSTSIGPDGTFVRLCLNL